MKEKGFTLVELLAVIAILAILVIMALPNIVGLFNNAKKNSFINEMRQIHSTATSQWVSDSMFDATERTYARVKDSNCSNELKLSGRTELDYYIKVDRDGHVIEYYASDGAYQYSYNGSELKREQITSVDQIDKMSDSDIIKITCNGSQSGEGNKLNGTFYTYTLTNLNVGDSVNGISVYNTPGEAMNLYSYPFFQKIVVANNNVTSIAIGFRKNGNDYILDPSNYSTSSNTLVTAFGSSICNVGTILTECSEGQGGMSASLSSSYAVVGDVGANGHGCYLSGSSRCE